MGSSVPAAMAALMTVAKGAISDSAVEGVAPVQYVDGEIGAYIAAEQFTMLGASWQDTPTTLVGGSPEMFRESYDINCVVRTSGGGTSTDLTTLRLRAMAMYGAVRNALSADQSMGGVILQAYCANGTLAAGVAGENIMAATVDFVVHVTNITSS